MKATFAKLLWPFRRGVAGFWRDRRGVAATELVFIVPVMLVAFFGTVEFCSAVAVDRKVTLIARALSDLTSQQAPSTNDASTIADLDLQNNFTAGGKIMSPYDPTPIKATISEVYVDKNSKA